MKGKINTGIWHVIILSLLSCHSMLSQVTFYGNTKVHSKSEVTVHADSIFFHVDPSAGSTSGITFTERSSPIGYINFIAPFLQQGLSDNSYIDGYVRTYLTTPFIFPIGNNGKYRPAAVDRSNLDSPIVAAYYGVNASVAILPLPGFFYTLNLGDKVQKVSAYEYWDINGASPARITLSWNSASKVSALIGGNFSELSIVGWNGSQWEVVPSTIDGTSVLGSISDLNSGSITTNIAVVPNTYEVYTLAGITVQKRGDTTIRPVDTSTIVLGPPLLLNPSTNYSLGGPYHGSGKGTIDVKTGVITFKPSDTPFIGKDTMYKIRCVIIGAVTTCDSSRIIIDGKPPKRTPVSDSANYNTGKTLADLPPINTGGKPYTTTTSSSAGSVVTLGTDGKVNYVPRNGFFGYDTVRVIRCVDGICDTVTYIIYVKKPSKEDIPNFISPNGDGLNDYWVLPSALYSEYSQVRAIIYNRWGNIVWRSTSTYKNDWYGQSFDESQPVPDGVYYYLLDLENDFKRIKTTGFIEVMRQ